jgi:hypothetical protein
LGIWENFSVPLQRILVALLVGALGLPILMCVLFALGRLLAAMQDAVGADAVGRISLALYVLWAADLIGLVVVQAVLSLNGPQKPPDDVE